MNKKLSPACACLVLSCVALSANALTLDVSVANKSKIGKSDSPVVLNLSDYNQLTKSARVTLNGKEIPCQLDDLNGDGRYDELVFLTDIKGKETQHFSVDLLTEGTPIKYDARVYSTIMLSDKGQKHPIVNSVSAPGSTNMYNAVYMHGAVFESELTAYRVYFDARQNIDLYGKVNRQLELEHTHFYSNQQLMDEGYGSDVLWVGTSVGCGTLKLWDGKTPCNFDSVATRGQHVIASGPVRAIIELTDNGIALPGADNLSITQRYTIYAGHRDFEATATFDRALGDTRLCLGVQKVGENPQGNVDSKSGLAVSWGREFPDKNHKDQYPEETIGLGLYVPTAQVDSSLIDDVNYLFTVGKDDATSLHYYVTFCADKEKDGYHSYDEWSKSLSSWKDDIDTPLTVTIKAK
jgi:hypothetical protein